MVDMQRVTHKIHTVCHINFAMILNAELICVHLHSIVIMARQLCSCLTMAWFTNEQEVFLRNIVLQHHTVYNTMFYYCFHLYNMWYRYTIHILHSKCGNTGQCRESSRKRNRWLWDPMYLKMATSGQNM
jgi:hypothetical protein